MGPLRALLRPQWLVLALVVVGFAVACFMVLAPWQLGKNSRTSHDNNLIKHNAAADTVPLPQLWTGTAFPDDNQWRTVAATGHFVATPVLAVRGSNVDDRPAYESLAIFQSTDGRQFLVDRGYLRPVSNYDLPPIPAPPAGEVTITARIRANEGHGKAPLRLAGTVQPYAIDSVQIGQALRLNLATGYLQMREGQPGAFAEIPLPQIDSGPYLSYGLQWIAFGVMAPLGLGYFAWSEIKTRRAERAAAANPPPDTDAAATTADVAPETPPRPSAPRRTGVVEREETKQKHQMGVGLGSGDRYGR